MLLSRLDFGSLLSYSPRGNSEAEARSRTTMRALKGDEIVFDPPMPMSEFIAEGIKSGISRFPFPEYFERKPILVPTPSSALTQPGTLWVPQRLANALVRNGLGRTVSECLIRATPVRKAATSAAAERPKAVEHYSSMQVQKILTDPEEILLVDDVVTRGATLLGAASLLKEAFPNSRIRAFAAMRTISPPDVFEATFAPCKGTIELNYGETFRRP